MGGKKGAWVRGAAIFLGVLFVACAAPRAIVLADDSEVGATGGSVYAIKAADIRMAAETVQATCFGDFAEYRVDFQFVNDGKARKVKLGFPFNDTVPGEHGTERPVGFQAWQNGRPLAVQAVPAQETAKGATHGYFLHVATFPHGATMITVSYLTHVSGVAMVRRRGAELSEYGGGMEQYYDYWLHTGSTWKGTIGDAVVRFRLADSFAGSDIELTAAGAAQGVRVTSPHWTKPLPRTYQWRFTDFEPKPAHPADWWKPQSRYDITLGYGAASWSQPPCTASSAAVSIGDAESAQDGMPSTFWAEGVPGPGVGQWLQSKLKKPTRLRELRILPGNNESDSSFRRFARPKTLKAIFSDGSSTILHLKDSPTLQRFPVNVTTRSVRLVIQSVYLGTEYPATCISEVELGTERAPGYASFKRLIADPDATGRLTAWAGPDAPTPSSAVDSPGDTVTWNATGFTEDLLGVDQDESFPADSAPFKEPSSPAAIAQANADAKLPERRLVGDPTAVNALSHRMFEIRYSSGIDLIVNTRVPGTASSSLTALQTDATDGMMDYSDGRRHPFEVLTIGHQEVGLAKAGSPTADEADSFPNVPAQAFWRAGDVAYHLFARSKAVTTDQLVAVARSLIAPAAAGAPRSATRPSSSWTWLWWLVSSAAVVALAAAVLLNLRRRAAVALPPESQ